MTTSQPPIAGRPSADDVREMVSRVLDGVLDEAPVPGDVDVEIEAEQPNGRVAIGADHGGFALKERIAFRLREQGCEVLDCGTDSSSAVDYPDFAHAVASAVASGKAQWGVIVDGAGIGSSMVANKVRSPAPTRLPTSTRFRLCFLLTATSG